jgi:hypothetical protein
LASHLGRQEIGELLFTAEGRSEVETISVEEMVDQSKQRIDGLVDSEVDGLVETGTKFDCPVEGLKNGIGEPVSEDNIKGIIL